MWVWRYSNVCKGLWRNGSAPDSRSEGWEFESLWPHFLSICWLIHPLSITPRLIDAATEAFWSHAADRSLCRQVGGDIIIVELGSRSWWEGYLFCGTQHEACSLVDSCLYKWPWHNKTNVRILTLAPHCQIRSKPIVVPMLFWKKKLLWDGTLLHLFLSIKDLQLDMPAEKKHFYISCHPSHPHSNAHVDELRWTHMYCAPKKNKKNLQLRSKKAQEPAKGTKPAQFKKWKRLVE